LLAYIYVYHNSLLALNQNQTAKYNEGKEKHARSEFMNVNYKGEELLTAYSPPFILILIFWNQL